MMSQNMTTEGMKMKIKEIRVKKGVTQLELAKKLGVSRSTVAMWEAGINTPNASKIPEISRVLGCESIDELFFEDEKKDPA